MTTVSTELVAVGFGFHGAATAIFARLSWRESRPDDVTADLDGAEWTFKRSDLDLALGSASRIRTSDITYEPAEWSGLPGIRIDLSGTTHAVTVWMQAEPIRAFLDHLEA